MPQELTNDEKVSYIIPPERLHYYQTHPVEFVQHIIFNKNIDKYFVTEQQQCVLNDLAHNRKLSIKAGRGVGKTAMLSWLIIWWQTVFPEAQVCAFAPSFGQLSSVLWPELAKWLQDSLVADCFVHTAKKMYLKRIGQRYYSFDHKGWHFMILDSVGETADRGYRGFIDSAQRAWIKRDLARVEQEVPIVVSVHIPFLSVVPQLIYDSFLDNDPVTVIDNSREVLDLFKQKHLIQKC